MLLMVLVVDRDQRGRISSSHAAGICSSGLTVIS